MKKSSVVIITEMKNVYQAVGVDLDSADLSSSLRSITGKYKRFVLGIDNNLFFIVEVLFVKASITGVVKILISNMLNHWRGLNHILHNQFHHLQRHI